MATTESVAKTICDKDFKTTSCDNLWQTSFKQQADWFNRLESVIWGRRKTPRAYIRNKITVAVFSGIWMGSSPSRSLASAYPAPSTDELYPKDMYEQQARNTLARIRLIPPFRATASTFCLFVGRKWYLLGLLATRMGKGKEKKEF